MPKQTVSISFLIRRIKHFQYQSQLRTKSTSARPDHSSINMTPSVSQKNEDPYLAGLKASTDTNKSTPLKRTAIELGIDPSVITEWHKPGPNAYDFHSDTITTPTISMLQAITATTLADDVYTGDPTTALLEQDIATLAGHEAGLLVMSGTMGNQVSMRAHLSAPPHSVLCDIRSHIANYEAGGIATLSGAQLITVTPSNNHHLTLADVKKHTILSDDVHACPTKIISLENTLNGTVMPLSEAKLIAQFAREHNIILHLDGARIWEAAAAGFGSLTEYCSLFDSVSLCFSKGLGAPIGSLIVGNKAFIKRAKWIRKMFGGATRQSGIISAAARVAVDEGFGTGPNGEGGRLRECHARAKQIGDLWTELGGKLTWPVETNMVWLDLAGSNVDADAVANVANEEGITLRGSGRIVIHYQICEEAIQGLERTLRRLMKERNGVVS